MSEYQQFRLLCRVHLRILRHRFIGHLLRSRLMSATVGLFLVAYSTAAYMIFSRGLGYIARLPAAGDLLADRVIYLIFFCFFLMLAFSTGVASYIALFRSRETLWMLTLPISHRVVCLWKCLEAAIFSSWGLLFITAPLLIAFARHRDAGPLFYLKTIAALVPFVVVTTGAAVAILLVIVRWFKRSHLVYCAIGVGLVMAFSALRTYHSDKELTERAGLSTALTFQLVLSHTDLSTAVLLPSAWLAESAIDWSRPWRRNKDSLNAALLFSHALLVLVVVAWLARRYFFDAWNLSLQHASASASRQRRKTRLAPDSRPCFLPNSPLLAVSIKDIRTFVREPSQWIQFLVIFGLLSFYALSLRHMEYDRSNPQESQLFAFLNLTVCALALSTLTTRFVFPQFSLEGRRFWILAMSPLHLPSIIIQKFLLSTLFTGAATFCILLLSGHMLDLSPPDIAFFATAIVFLSVGLNAIAVGFGALFPNMKETDSGKIVSGFGGTICLITSFAYIALFIVSLAIARISLVKAKLPLGFHEIATNQIALAGILVAVIVTSLATILPIIFSIKTIKKLAIFDKI